jgi:hypothetical protein
MTRDKRRLLQEWNPYNPTYDFVSAAVRRTSDGCEVAFTRFVMADDYVPRVEHSALVFPYARQARYKFFDIGSIAGVYRNSPRDINLREFF